MKPHLICCVLILALLPSRLDALRIYKIREELLNLLGTDEVGEERLYMEDCHQSSETGTCMLAIDDSVLTEWTQCSASEPEDMPWWRALMEMPSYITRVVISTAELPDVEMIGALWDFSIIVNGFTCYRHFTRLMFTSMSFDCDALADRLVIQSHLLNSVLALCEVIPYGIPITFQGMDVGAMEIHLANCHQSSVYQGRDCKYALDRNFETRPTDLNGKVCAESDFEKEPFWVAYFPLPTLVKYVKVFQRMNLGAGMHNIKFRVNGLICNKYKNVKYDRTLFESHVFPCDIFGSNLMIEEASKHERSKFAICQVQVFGHEMVIQRDAESRYIGCFNDNPEKPDLDLLMAYTWMSPAKCHRMCKRMNKKFFGLQNGQVCMCGDKYGRYGEVGENGNGNSTVSTETADSSEPCSRPCKGAKEFMCGGRYENSVYEIIV